jgi:hypothetical protein
MKISKYRPLMLLPLFLLFSLLENCYLPGTASISPEMISSYESSRIMKITLIDNTDIIFDKDGGKFSKTYGTSENVYKITGNDIRRNKIEKETTDVLIIQIESDKYNKYSGIFIIPAVIIGLILLIPVIFFAFHPFHNC